MDQPELDQLLIALKNHIQENDGEVAYWGNPIDLSGLRPPTPQQAQIPKPGIPTSKAERLEHLRTQVIGDCQLCPLGATRVKLVFGVGHPDADVMFIGEGPGFDEDKKGEPFVGKAGRLLDKIMAAIGLNRTNTYIANVVKCHPMINPKRPEMRGNDRPPGPREMDTCFPFLLRQIAVIEPKMIVTLGATAAKAVLKSNDGITKMRGKIQKANLLDGKDPIAVLPTYHPAALLRDPALKRPVWEDMKLLRSVLNNHEAE